MIRGIAATLVAAFLTVALLIGYVLWMVLKILMLPVTLIVLIAAGLYESIRK